MSTLPSPLRQKAAANRLDAGYWEKLCCLKGRADQHFTLTRTHLPASRALHSASATFSSKRSSTSLHKL